MRLDANDRPEPIDPRRLLADAHQHYLTDPDFHARVEYAVAVIEATHDLTDEDDSALLVQAATMGLAMQWVDLRTGRTTNT